MRRTLFGLATAGMAVLALGGCAGAVRTSGPAKAGSAGKLRTADANPASVNRAAAERDAADLLRRLRLPSAAVRLRGEPSGDHGYLKPLRELEGDSASVTAYGWWVSEERPSEVLAYVTANPPSGSSQSGTGSLGNSFTHTLALDVGFAWPPVGNVLGYRELQVTATTLPDGRTGILAEAQSDWVVLRSWSERVPAGVTAVRIRLQPAPRRPGSTKLGRVSHALIRSPREVARAISLVDSLAVVQPIEIACPLNGFPAGSLTVTYGAGPAGPALAQARVMLFPGGRNGGAGECDPIEFSIRGHTQKALIGASFAGRIERLAGLGGECRKGRGVTSVD